MNEVFLSGIIETMPKQVAHVNETPHLRLLLRVSHRTVAGVEKQERYPINAWRATASRLLELAKPGSRMSLKGYLSQHTTANGTLHLHAAPGVQVYGRQRLHLRRQRAVERPG